MTVRSTMDGTIELAGRCGVEDAEALQGFLLEAPRSAVEWSGCQQLHSAVLQVLLIGKPSVIGTPPNTFLRTHVAPLLRSARKTTGSEE